MLWRLSLHAGTTSMEVCIQQLAFEETEEEYVGKSLSIGKRVNLKMSHGSQEHQGTGLRDVFDVVVKAPPERLLSLTFQLNETPEDNIIHALCLMVLRREAQALDKLQALRDNELAKHLAQNKPMSVTNLEDFAIHCGHFQDFTWKSLVALARIFKVLSEKRLCDPLLRDLAYKRALSSVETKTSTCENLEFDQLGEEAKVVCGPQFAEWVCSSTVLKSSCDLYGSLAREESTSLKVTLSQDQSERAQNLPSPLQAGSLTLSYPTHLEISIPPTAVFQDDVRPPETSDKSKPNTPALLFSQFESNVQPGLSQTSEAPVSTTQKDSRMDETFAAEKKYSLFASTQTTKPTTEPNVAPAAAAASFVLPKMPVANEVQGAEEEEEEEATFYAFVILHAPEDADVAESMRERLESVIGSECEGATFSGDFATPGRSALGCVEDAINNTAFTLLLLTRNFNTRMLNLEADSALINSINKKHKYNTVIPLLPRDNCMPRQSLPLVLQTLLPLEENKSFERKIQRAMSPASIKRQKRFWMEEQRVKIQIARQERLKQLKEHRAQLNKECEAAQALEGENLRLLMARQLLLNPAVLLPGQEGGDGRAWWPQNPSIHIENAKYIMIGNDSQMTVGGGTDEDDDLIYRAEEP